MSDTVSTVAALVQFIADDRDAQFIDLAIQMPAIRAGWREFQRRMTLRDAPFMQDTVEINVAAAITTMRQGGTLLPDDFNYPLILHEKQQNQSNDSFNSHLMIERTELPDDLSPFTYRGFWKFEAGEVRFLAATADGTIRMRYARTLPDLDNEDSEITVPLAADALAWLTLVMVGLARGVSEEYRQRCEVRAQAAIDDLSATYVKRSQLQRRRRGTHAYGRF